MTGKFLGCIAEAAAQGLDKATAEDARESYAEAFAAKSQTLGPGEADRAAGQAVIDELAAKALRAKQLQALSVRARRAALESAAAFKTARGYTDVAVLGGKGGKPPPGGGWVQGGAPPPKGPWKAGGAMADWLKELIDGSGGLAGGAGASVKGRYQALMGTFQAMMADLADKFETVSGLPHRGAALLDNVVRESFGEDTGDAAAQRLAQAWDKTADFARQTFNAAGGSIRKLEAWGLPQAHDPLGVRALGKDAWVQRVMPALDRVRMVDQVTGQPFTDKRLAAALGDVWDSIVSQGAMTHEQGQAHVVSATEGGAGMLANRRADPRFLIFKDADHWLAYAREFGMGDPYAAMMRHLDGMARDIAQMQVLGPNPRHAFEFLARTAKLEAMAEQAMPGVASQNLVKTAGGDIDSARKMLGLFTGELGTAYGPGNILARVGVAVRAGLSAAQLGSAPINDFTTNPIWAAQVKAFLGMSQTPDFKAWAGHVFAATTRQQARRAGFILESARVREASAVRDFLRGQTVGSRIANGANALARLLPTWVHRASFLQSNFAASRWGFQHELMGHLADLAGSSLEQLHASANPAERATAQILTARGISPADWDKIRAVAPELPEEGGFLSPEAVRAATGDSDLSWRLAELIERETRNAVPEPSLWAQAQLTADNRPGTIKGELVRSLAAYRSFTVTQTYTWAREFQHRAWLTGSDARLPWQLRAAAMAAPLLTSLTLGGLLAVWLKDISKGSDPRPLWDDTSSEDGRKQALRTIGAAMAQGGGQGILGDFFQSVLARNDKGPAATALGAPAGFIGDTWGVTGDAANVALSGNDPHEGRRLSRYMSQYAPVASIWWLRTAFNRAVTDQLQRQLDPDAESEFERRRSQLERDYNTQQWWPQGQILPERAPSFEHVTGKH